MKRRTPFLTGLTAAGSAFALLVGSAAVTPRHVAASDRRPSISQGGTPSGAPVKQTVAVDSPAPAPAGLPPPLPTSPRWTSILRRDRQPALWVDQNVRVDPSVHALGVGETIPNEVILAVQPGISPDGLARRFGLSVKRYLSLPNTVVVSAPDGDARSKISLLARSPQVRYAEANKPVRMMAIPNDPLYSEQWAPRLIHAPEAWDIQRGTIDSFNPGVTVAVLDTGINFAHPDLQGRILSGGHDFFNNDNDPSDDNGHGSHVSGIIAAATNNNRGVAGMTWAGVMLLPVKILDRDGNGTVDTVAQGLRFAADAGARLINLSVGTPDDSTTLRSAVQYALNAPQKPIIICAAGNNSDRRMTPPSLGPVVYPANYPYDRIIAVGAVGPDGQVSYYSSENTTPASSTQGGVDIAAPGGSSRFSSDTSRMVLSTSWSATRAEQYDYMEGTSQAAPFVTGVAALLLSEGARTTDVENLLYSTATRTTAGRTEALGWGVVNAQAALQATAASIRIVWPTPDFPSETVNTLVLTRLQNATLAGLQVTMDGTPLSNPTSQSNAGTLDVRYHVALPAGSHSLTVTAASSLTGRTRSASTAFQVAPHVLASPGFQMFSVPYFLQPASASPDTVFAGHPYRLARYSTADRVYALFDPTGGVTDPNAGFNPPSTGLVDNPAGLGYWLRLGEPTALVLDGDPVLDAQYRIPIATGWAMIGDPFVFPVSLGAAQVQVSTTTVSMAQAIANGWVRSMVYRYNGSDGYIATTTTSTSLNPWDSLWLQAKVDLVLILPGVQ